MPLRRTAGTPSTASGSGAVAASVAKRFPQQVEPPLELLVARGQRREEPDHVSVEPAREEEQALLEGRPGRRLRGVGRRLAQLEREHRAQAAGLPPQRPPTPRLPPPR